jgi:hypothetical protein
LVLLVFFLKTEKNDLRFFWWVWFLGDFSNHSALSPLAGHQYHLLTFMPNIQLNPVVERGFGNMIALCAYNAIVLPKLTRSAITFQRPNVWLSRKQSIAQSKLVTPRLSNS